MSCTTSKIEDAISRKRLATFTLNPRSQKLLRVYYFIGYNFVVKSLAKFEMLNQMKAEIANR